MGRKQRLKKLFNSRINNNNNNTNNTNNANTNNKNYFNNNDSIVTNANNGIVGLKNLGNTCYMNASLQCLRNIKSFREHIFDENKNNLNGNNNKLIKSYYKFVHNIWEPAMNKTVMSPADIKNEFGKYKRNFSGFGQQDAQEFIIYLLDAIHENTKNENKQSIISELFVGKYKSTVVCGNCEHSSITYEDFMFLSLPVTENLEKSLSMFSAHDDLDNNNKYKCEKCKHESIATKMMQIHKMPNVLIVYLKRFNVHKKIDNYMDAPLTYINNNDGNTYELTGIVNHFGTKHGGHYTAYIRINDVWFDMNDSSYRALKDSSNIVTNNAYILFYEKQNEYQ
ncbi:MAG: ubiquitin carboxyl-terminal hydrolase 2 [Terrestrivirus sp.]|uniref:Ubiquitin carboxyl-terminal hydrolase 2 n=1 Tax=Terrestrivirus sp. TaxID=2487775 RepID=A0A3G4ZN36_9VIRU|nr:MAG: ubiquitin carboxyl-terminal hydrolase 2 [Terrestrivirus sp.]